MSADRLTGSDRRSLLFWLVVAIAGGLFASKFYFQAFPEASVNFKISRAEALDRARQFANSSGENLAGYESTIVFAVEDEESDGYAKTYLERQLGLAEANRLMTTELNIWYWNVRFFRPQQKEEFSVQVTPSGRIAGYRHVVEEARAGASLDRAAAEGAARQFLTARTSVDLSQWDFLPEEASSQKKPNRLDWSFTWEKRGFRAADAPYRLRIALQGDRVGNLREYLQIPEQWERDYKHLRSGNDFLTVLATVPWIALLGAALWTAISLTRKGQTQWGGAIKLGTVVALLFFLMQLNEWPLTRAGYNTNTSYGSFVVSQIFLALITALFSALTVSLVLPAAEPLYRASQPSRIRLSTALTLRGIRTKEFFNASFVGLCMAVGHIGFIVAFYMYGRQVGVWAPQDISYSDTVNTAFPWISGAAIGLLASTSEEFLFRLFAIPFFERLTKSRWIAVILPAFLWSFLHSNYPQEPPYIRGIEIGIIGIVAGLVMLRWGILATLVWHYTVDALLVGLLLLRSDSLYFKISGAVVGAAAVAPLAYAAISYLLRGKFEPADDLLNSAQPLVEDRVVAVSAAETPGALTGGEPAQISAGEESRGPATVTARSGIPGTRHEALSSRMILFLAACAAGFGFVLWKVQSPQLGEDQVFSTNAREARLISDKALQARGISTDGFRVTTILASTMDAYTNEYLRRTVGIAAANRIYAEEVPGALWRTRYFRDGQPEEFAVIVRPGGGVHSVRHTLPENAPGAFLPEADAISRAEDFLRREKKIDLSAWRLVEHNSEKRPHRTDHTLVWERTVGFAPSGEFSSLGAGRAPALPRIELQVLGDQVANYRTFIKIPDEWRRQQGEQTLPRTLYRIGRVVFFAGFVAMALLLFLLRLRSEPSGVPWRSFAGWAIAGFLAIFLNLLLGTVRADTLSNYTTEVPFNIFVGIAGVGLLLSAVFLPAVILLALGFAWAYGSRAFGADRLPAKKALPGIYYRDALWLGLGGSAALLGVQKFFASIASHWPTLHRSMESSLPTGFYAVYPIASVASVSLMRGLFYACLIALAGAFIASELRATWQRAGLFLLTAFFLVGDWGSTGDLGKQFIARVLVLAIIVLGVTRIARFNLLGYFLIGATITLVEGTAELMSQPNAFYRMNGYLGILLGCALYAWLLISWRLRADSKAS